MMYGLHVCASCLLLVCRQLPCGRSVRVGGVLLVVLRHDRRYRQGGGINVTR